MERDVLWQSWITLMGRTSGPPNSKLIQPANKWLDMKDEKDALFRFDIQDTGPVGVTLYLETGSNAAGPWTALATFSAATKVTKIFSKDTSASDSLQRFVRWSVDTPNNIWNMTFQISTRGNVGRQKKIEENVDSGKQIELQELTSVIGDFAAATIYNVIASQENWLDTTGLDKVQIEVESLESSGATLVIEKAMSLEGPWTTVESVSTCYTNTEVTLSSEALATYPIARFVRWHIESTGAPWRASFRINARTWP